jgi:hypothetical protein
MATSRSNFDGLKPTVLLLGVEILETRFQFQFGPDLGDRRPRNSPGMAQQQPVVVVSKLPVDGQTRRTSPAF